MIQMEPNAQSAADRVDCGIGNVKALLGAVDDKLRVYLLDQSLFGAYYPLIRNYALDMQALLSMAMECLTGMERDQNTVTDVLYGIQKSE